jgi:hypothetical protein
MSDNEERMKTIKVSEDIHEELAKRKYGGESFNELLERELGLIPQTIDAITAPLSERLATATQSIIKDYIDEVDRFRTVGRRDEHKFTLKYISNYSNKVIYEVRVYLTRPERVNHKVEIRYRNPQNTLKLIARLRDIESNAVKIKKLKEFDTKETKQNTRKGDDPGQGAADLVGPEVSKFVEQAYSTWGKLEG